MTERCEVTDLLKSQCGHCRGSAERPVRGPWFTARYDGKCDGPCGQEFEAGDTIRSDGEGGWLCQDCGSQ